MPKPPRAAGQRLIELERERGVVPTAKFRGRHYRVEVVSRDWTPEAVKELREKLSCSQPILAAFLGVSVNTLRRWEQGRDNPKKTAARLLDEISGDLDYWKQRLQRCLKRKSGKWKRRTECPVPGSVSDTLPGSRAA